MLSSLLTDAMKMSEKMVVHRRYLHANAEVGFDLPKTHAYVTKTLQQMGYEPQNVGKCGIVATIGSGKPVVLLRADMDALPMEEKTGLPFACHHGHAHTCGHDLHTTMLLGAAALLKDREQEIRGTVKLMFQPAEEPLAGASDMIANGLLEHPKPASALMIHVMNTCDVKPGTVVIAPAGASAPAADMFEIHIQGKGCHGAMPHHGVDAVNAGAHLVLALQAISARECGMNDAHALTIASFQAGETTNVMPDQAVLKGSVRSYDLKTQQFLKKRIEEISQMTAQTFRASAKVHWLNGCPTLVNEPELVAGAKRWLPKIIGDERVLTADRLSGGNARSVGSEDFSYISQQVPSLILVMTAGGVSDLPLHHPRIIFNEEALPYGAAVYAGFALEQMGYMAEKNSETV